MVLLEHFPIQYFLGSAFSCLKVILEYLLGQTQRGLRRAVLFNDRAISFLQSRIYKDTSIDDKYVPIFIVGSPRSGSTVLYQMLTHSLDCVYVDNLSFCFFSKLPFGVWLSFKIFGKNSHNQFTSKFGITGSFHSPNECPGYWKRYFDSNTDYIPKNGIGDKERFRLRSEINQIMNMHEAGMIIKYLSNSQRVALLSEIFPKAKVHLYSKRPFVHYTVAVQRKKKKGLKDDEWWSIKPRQYDLIKDRSIFEKLVSQVYYSELQIVEDFAALEESRFITVNYLDFASKYQELMEFCEFKIKNRLNISDFSFSNQDQFTVSERVSVENHMSEFNWTLLGYE